MNGEKNQEQDERLFRRLKRLNLRIARHFPLDMAVERSGEQRAILLSLLSELRGLSSSLVRRRDGLRTQIDGARRLLTAAGAYSQASRLGQQNR